MYKDYFRLKDIPFSIAPDPRFLFMSERHREALAHLMYALEGDGGIVLLTGEVGTGKTTVSRCLLDGLPNHCDVALVLNPRLSAIEMLATVCDEFHLVYPPDNTSVKVFTDALNTFLLSANAQGRKALLIIDEAQNLAPEVLEQVRLLTNLETNTRKLLRVILVGQPELLDLLGRPDLRQVEQRVVARYHLTHLSKDETAAYVTHRLNVSGAQTALIPDKLFGMLYRATGGVPRLVNVICDRALLGAYVRGKDQVNRQIMRNAIQEARGTPVSKPKSWGWLWALTALIMLAVGLGLIYQNGKPSFDIAFWAQAATPAEAEEPAPSVNTPVAATLPDPAASGTPAIPPPAPPVAAPPLPIDQALSWPAAVPPEQAEFHAYKALLGLYGGQYVPMGELPPCRQVESHGLRCLSGHGDLFMLRYELNLPAILQWQDKDRSYPVLLDHIEGERARLVVGGESREVSVDDLAQHWRGGFVTLWRPPPGYTGPINPQAGGHLVTWLQEALARVNVRSSSPLREFQHREGIHPDGLAGPYTLIRLNQLIEPQGVRLVAAERNR